MLADRRGLSVGITMAGDTVMTWARVTEKAQKEDELRICL